MFATFQSMPVFPCSVLRAKAKRVAFETARAEYLRKRDLYCLALRKGLTQEEIARADAEAKAAFTASDRAFRAYLGA